MGVVVWVGWGGGGVLMLGAVTSPQDVRKIKMHGSKKKKMIVIAMAVD